MADQTFPQVPSTVWWGVRQMLLKTPGAKFDETMLAVTLGVQSAASRQYIAELKRLGIFDDDGRATDLAREWRLDTSYSSAVEKIASKAYPESLRTVCPPDAPDRQKAIDWFQHQGLGEGAARNKAATYLLVTSMTPNDATGQQRQAAQRAVSGANTVKKDTGDRSTRTKPQSDKHPPPRGRKADGRDEMPPLNVNVQIHISAEAGNDQIEAIFKAMRTYLRND